MYSRNLFFIVYEGLISLSLLLIDQHINDPLFKKSGKQQLQEEGTCKDMDIALRKKKTDTAERMTEATENKEGNKDCKLICSTDHAQWQLKIDVGNKVTIDNEKTHGREALEDPVLSNVVNDKGSLGRNKSYKSKVIQPALKDQPWNSANTTAVPPTSKMDVHDGAQPLKLSSNSARVEQSSNTTQMDIGINREITKDSTDLLKTDESSMNLGTVMSQERSETLLTCQGVGEGDGTETGEKSQTSGTENKEKDLIDLSGGNVNNTSQKGKSLGKKVRFNLEGSETSTSSTLQPPNSTEEISKEETKIMFSDEEDKEDKEKSIDEDVSQRISRIQNLLRSDRLRTNRKRKYPVV